MATLTTFTAATTIRSADVNANFVAMNTEIAGAMRTGFASASIVGNIGGGTDDLHSWTMPANTLAAVGDGFLVHTNFEYAANTNAKTVLFKIGSPAAVIQLNRTTAAPNGRDLVATIRVWVITVATGLLGMTCTSFLADPDGDTPALETVYPYSTVTVGSLAADIVVKFTGAATTTNDILQLSTTLTTFKAT